MAAPREMPKMRRSVDLTIVGENILDIADYAIEKYEFSNETRLTDAQREAAVEQVRDELWEMVKNFRSRRKQWLQRMFESADNAVSSAVTDA